jgi:hypothetical protein
VFNHPRPQKRDLGYPATSAIYCSGLHVRAWSKTVTKRVIHTVPTKLSHACIYLDDLFEIEGILSKEYAKLSKSTTISFEYEIDKNVVLTTHEELIEYGGYSNNFVVNVLSSECSYPDYRVLSMYHMLNPELRLLQVSVGQQWTIYGLVEDVFKKRQSINDKLKTFIQAIPDSIVVSFGLIIIVYCGLMMGTAKSLWALSYLAPLILIVVFCLIAIRGNRIYFRSAKQDERERTEVRKQRIERFIWVVVTAIITAISTHAVDRIMLLHK